MFEQIRRDSEPGSDAWASSTLGLAVSLHQLQPDVRADKERAADLYDELMAGCTNRAIVAQAILLRARIAGQVDYSGDTADPNKATLLYDRIRNEFPESREAAEATLYLGHAAAMSGNPERARAAIKDIRQWIEEHPDSSLASLEWGLIGRLNMYPLDDPLAAAKAFINSEKAGLPPMTQMDAHFWRIANLAEQGGDQKTAVEYFRRIIIEQPRSGYGYEAQLRLKELGEEAPPLTDPFDFMIEKEDKTARPQENSLRSRT